MSRPVEIAFDCLPLRSVGRLDAPLDASPRDRQHVERIQAALQQHDVERAYYLYNAHCTFHLANSDIEGMVRFELDGVLSTDSGDARAQTADLRLRLVAQTCGEVPREVEAWLGKAVHRAVCIEFDRYIAAGERDRCVEQLEEQSPAGFEGQGV